LNSDENSHVKTFMYSLSDADRSILQAAVDQIDAVPETLLTTTPGTNNDRVWAVMSQAGLMTAADPLDVPIPSKVYRIEPTAREEIKRLLAEIEHGAVIVKIVNEFRERIPPLLTQAIHGAGGSPFDLAMILGCIVDTTMRSAIKPELYDEFLAQVAKIAGGMRAAQGK
jgi:hypothetical protein